MKKLLSITALLMTAVLILAGCSNSSGGGDSEKEKLPGSWFTTSNTELDTAKYTGIYEQGTLTGNDDGTFVFELARPDLIPTDKKPAADSYSYYSMPVVKEEVYTGFKATTNALATTYNGFVFNYTDGKPSSFYALILHNDSYSLYAKVNGSSEPLTRWSQNAAIKPEKDNEVLVYTEKDGSITIKINGTKVDEIKNPVIKKGSCGVVCAVSSDDCDNKTAIKATYKFKEFQK